MARPSSPLPAALGVAAGRFAAWRSSRTDHRIPEDLWSVAADLGARYGVSRTSRALRVRYYDLKARIEGATRGVVVEPAASSSFVEILTAPAASPAECVVEIENGSGAKMRVHLKGPGTAELVALSRAFLGVPA